MSDFTILHAPDPITTRKAPTFEPPMSSSMLGGFSVSVSDADSEDLAGRIRVRSRRKRRRPESRLRRAVARWWPLALFFPALALLIYQASKIGAKPAAPSLDQVVEDAAVSREEPPGNLDRLGARTRVVNGVREPCLKLLSNEEIRQLDFPGFVIPTSPKSILYKSVLDESHISTYNFSSQKLVPGTRFNLFTGNQTFEEREESLKVNETVTLHCGFYSENGGFRISEEDKGYMNTCSAVVSTCAFGGGDDLYQPIGMVEESLSKVCYVAFWDEITVSAQEANGVIKGEDHMIGKWRIVVVRNLPFSDQRLNGKIPKMLSHRLFPQARYSIWVDSKSQFRRDPMGVLEALLWRTNSALAISEHGARSNIYEEGNAIVKKHKATPEEVDIQLSQYRKDKFPDDKRFRGKKALSEASVIVREHIPLTNMLMCLWFNEVVRFTSRDQLSFPYVLRRLGLLKINMFPVCTRKDLVNSMGHKRKVKPLTN